MQGRVGGAMGARALGDVRVSVGRGAGVGEGIASLGWRTRREPKYDGVDGSHVQC